MDILITKIQFNIFYNIKYSLQVVNRNENYKNFSLTNKTVKLFFNFSQAKIYKCHSEDNF